MMKIDNEKDLGRALKEEQDCIEIEGDLATKVVRIKATGRVAWCVCIGCFIVAIPLAVAAIPTGGATAVAAIAPLAPAIATIGAPAAISAVMIAVAAGGVGVLNSLRKYKIVQKNVGCVILKRL